MNKFFRLLWLYMTAHRRASCTIAGPCLTPFVVMPTDLDIFFHMNNGVYFSIMDLGRIDLLLRSGLFKLLRQAGYGATVASETIRFRRSLKPFQRYMLETRVVGWDEKAFLLEQRFLLKDKRSGSLDVVAEGLVRIRFMSRRKALASADFLKLIGRPDAEPPALPAWIANWNAAQARRQNLERAPSIVS